MPNFRATNTDTDEVLTYDSVLPEPAHLSAPWRLEEVSEAFAAPDAPVDTRVFGGRRRLTKLEFVQLIAPEYVSILAAARQSVEIEAWIKMIDLATPDPDGTSIGLDDARIAVGLAGLQAAGLFTAERVAEVLNG